MFCVSVCPVVPLLLAKDFEGDYLEEENPRVSEMSNEFMDLKFHITHFLSFLHVMVVIFSLVFCNSYVPDFSETTGSSSQILMVW